MVRAVGLVVVVALLSVALWALARASRSPSPAAAEGATSATPVDGRQVPPCRITGCSGQVCSDEDVITTCEWRPEYVCYETAICEPAPDGECGWRMDAQLQDCLERTQ